MLTLQVHEKEIEIITSEEFVRGTVGKTCQIDLDKFWADYSNTIVFKRCGGKPINILIDKLSNTVTIPFEVMAESGVFRIGVFGVTEDKVLPTLWSGEIKVRYGTDTYGTEPAEYTPDEIEQLKATKQDYLGLKLEKREISAVDPPLSLRGFYSIASQFAIFDYYVITSNIFAGVPGSSLQIALNDKDNVISFNHASSSTLTKLKNVGAGVEDTDVANVGQLKKKQDLIDSTTDLTAESLIADWLDILQSIRAGESITVGSEDGNQELTISPSTITHLTNSGFGTQISFGVRGANSEIELIPIGNNDVILTRIGAGTRDEDAVNVSQLNEKQDKFADVIDGTTGDREVDLKDSIGHTSGQIIIRGNGVSITNIINPTSSSQTDYAVNKGYVDNAIATQVSSVYKAKGSIPTISDLPTPSKDTEGFVYNIESEFTTNSNFVEGVGKTYPAGTNVVIVNTEGKTYKYDVLAGMVDLTNYATKTDLNNYYTKSQTYTKTEVDNKITSEIGDIDTILGTMFDDVPITTQSDEIQTTIGGVDE